MHETRETRNRPPPAPEAPTSASPSAPARPEDLLLGMARIFAIVPLYPAAHTRSRAVGERFLAELRAALPESSALTLEVHREGLRVQGQPVPLDAPQIRRIHHDLAALGVARVEISADAHAEELHRFATVILEARRRVGAAHGFRQLVLDELPDSTRVVQREFGRRGADAREDCVRDAVERVLEGADSAHVDDGTRTALRSAIERVFGGVIETLAARQTAPPGGQPFGRSLEDVLDLGVHALRQALDELCAAGSDPAGLRSLFDATEKALAISDDRVSVEILLSVLSQSSREPSREKPAADADTTAYTLSIAALRDQLARYGDGAPPLVRVEPGDRREELSILLHVLLAGPPPTVLDGATVRLGSCLAEPLAAAERALLVEALCGLALRTECSALDLALPAVTSALRAAPDPGLLGSFWRELIASAGEAALDSLWPHLVNDLLLGLPGDTSIQRELLRCAARAGGARRAQKLARLTRLEAVRSRRFAADLFDPPPPELYTVFADLLARDGEQIGERLLQGLRRHPPQWPGAEALSTFSSVTPACRAFLFALLREGAVQEASPALVLQARRVLASALGDLPRAGVGAEWVPRAIDALAAISDPAELSILREIRRGFRPWPWRRWPAACRAAAARALAAPRPAADASPENQIV